MAYRALYRKYRPKGFADIVGQPALVQSLRAQVAAGRVSHAYLFSGPRGTGKTSAAKVLARTINCADPVDGEACGHCRPCVELASEANMDVVEIDAASNNSVDKVREMLENVKYMPAVGRYRVYIVDEVHMLSTSAFNALLKTLEEPPAHVVFILATTEPQKLPATVLSRCQQFQFRRIGAAEMTALLRDVVGREGGQADDEALRRIARAADGGMRDALSLLDQCLSGGAPVTAQTVTDLLGSADEGCYEAVADCILTGDAAGAIDGLDRFLAGGGDCRVFAGDLSRHLRDLMVARVTPNAAQALDMTDEEAARLVARAKGVAVGDILRALGELIELDGALRYAANPRIPVELALLRCCRQEKPGDYEALLTRVERLEAALREGSFAQPVDRAPAQPAAAPAPAATATPADDAPARATPAPAAHPAAPADDLPPWEAPPPSEEPGTVVPAHAAPAPAHRAAPVDDLPPWEAPPPGEEPGTAIPAHATAAPAHRTAPASAPPADHAAPRGGSALARAAAELSGLPQQEEPTAPSPQADSSAVGLWRAVVDGLTRRNLPHLVGFASRGKGQAYDGQTLTVGFTQDDRGAADMLQDERRITKLNEVASEVCGRPVQLKFEVSLWSPAEQRFIQQSREVLPPNTTITVERD